MAGQATAVPCSAAQSSAAQACLCVQLHQRGGDAVLLPPGIVEQHRPTRQHAHQQRHGGLCEVCNPATVWRRAVGAAAAVAVAEAGVAKVRGAPDPLAGLARRSPPSFSPPAVHHVANPDGHRQAEDKREEAADLRRHGGQKRGGGGGRAAAAARACPGWPGRLLRAMQPRIYCRIAMHIVNRSAVALWVSQALAQTKRWTDGPLRLDNWAAEDGSLNLPIGAQLKDARGTMK